MATLEQELDEVRKLKTFTLEEVDQHLTDISNVLRVSRKANKVGCFKRADRWLDLRLEVTNG